MDINKLSDHELLDQFERMVCWYHYDPHGRKKPSEFDKNELRHELRERLEKSSCPDNRRREV